MIGYRQTIKQPKGYATIIKSSDIELEGREASIDPLTELLRTGARQLIQQAVEAELQVLLATREGRSLPGGRTGVISNGHLPEREIQAGLGPVTVQSPKARAEASEPVTFRTALLPPLYTPIYPYIPLYSQGKPPANNTLSSS